MNAPSRIPTGLKLAYAAWLAVWVPAYWLRNGPDNFLWLCDVANFVVGLALFRDSALLLSSQAAGVLLIQTVWVIDVLGRAAFGRHPVGGTEYMFDPASPLWLRLLSLFHAVMPPLLLWGLKRLGYDRRGWRLQSALTAVILPLSWLLTLPADNVNWVWRPFGLEQRLVPPAVWLALCLVLYPLVLFYPTHRLLLLWTRRRSGPRVVA
jgi:hypothetical protein